MNNGKQVMSLRDILFDNVKISATADAITDLTSRSPTITALEFLPQQT